MFRRLGWVRFIGDRFEVTQVQGGQLPFVVSNSLRIESGRREARAVTMARIEL